MVGWVRKEETELGLAWLRWWRHYSDGVGSPELNGGDGKSKGIERRRTATTPGLYRAAKAQGGDTQCPAHASAKPKAATGATGRQSKLAVGELASAVTVHRIYRIATRLISIYSKFYMVTQKSPKIKVVQKQKFYNFAFITTP